MLLETDKLIITELNHGGRYKISKSVWRNEDKGGLL